MSASQQPPSSQQHQSLLHRSLSSSFLGRGKRIWAEANMFFGTGGSSDHRGGGSSGNGGGNNHNDGRLELWNASSTNTTRTTATTNTNTTSGTVTTVVAIMTRWYCLQSLLGVAVILYVLNQKHWLPLSLSRRVSHYLFWPTLPLTLPRRKLWLREPWCTVIDDTVIMGGAPFAFAGYPETLYHKYNVRGVVNLCEEYRGPIRRYQELGMEHLHLPTPDHFEPSVEALEEAVQFIREFQTRTTTKNKNKYNNERRHGRSAAVVLAHLLSSSSSQDPSTTALILGSNAMMQRKELNEQLCKLRKVRKTLWKQDNIKQFHAKLRQQQQEQERLVVEVDEGSSRQIEAMEMEEDR